MVRVELNESVLVDSPRERSGVEVGNDGSESDNEIGLLDEVLDGREGVGSDWKSREKKASQFSSRGGDEAREGRKENEL